jgi:peptidoglycan hydrolase FlgJ
MEKRPINNVRGVAEIRPAETGPGARPPEKLDREKLQKACTEFESLLMFQMLKFMRRSVPAHGLLGGGPGQDIYQGLFDQELSKSLARKGGLGVGEKIYRQMIQRVEKESPKETGLSSLQAGRGDAE